MICPFFDRVVHEIAVSCGLKGRLEESRRFK
jgi:hypothetical protein